MVESIEGLKKLIKQYSMLPLFSDSIEGFSAEEATDISRWWTGNIELDPWEWRTVIAADEYFAYGKLFKNKAGYITREFFPKFSCWRRDGYDFDTMYELGHASMNEKRIMDVIEASERPLASFEIKHLTGITKGFEGAMTRLQMHTYITVCGFKRKVNKAGEEYGWAASVYTTPEKRFGYDFVRSEYGRENVLGEEILELMKKNFPKADIETVKKFLKV